jgi:hypothetical protein
MKDREATAPAARPVPRIVVFWNGVEMSTRHRGIWPLVALTALAGCDDDGMTPQVETTFEVRVENVSATYDFPVSGSFDTPAGGTAPGPILPGGVYEFEFSAPPGGRLSLVTMMAQSNDLFYAPEGDGIALWDMGGNQVEGDVTAQIALWDAGTESNEEPGLGADQAPRQSAPNTGADDPDAAVRPAPDTYGNLPAVSDAISLTLTSIGPNSWVARIENVGDAGTLSTSDGGMHPVPLSPGVFVVHTEPDPLFTSGEPDRGEGLEGIAEDGAAATLAADLAGRTGATGILSPGAYAVHSAPSVLFAAGMPDAGLGLEAIAEDGDPAALATALSGATGVTDAGAFDTPEGASGAGPATPGAAYAFTITAVPGDRLSLATMYVQSNDLFFAPAESGIDLFPGGTALSGDVTGMVLLWDAGTEVNEQPGVGLHQAPRQSAPDTGPAEGGDVRQVNDGFSYGAVSDHVRVTITPTG